MWRLLQSSKSTGAALMFTHGPKSGNRELGVGDFGTISIKENSPPSLIQSLAWIQDISYESAARLGLGGDWKG